MLQNRMQLRFDAADSAFFLRELESIEAQVYEVQYPELMIRQLVPVDHSDGPGAEAITYRMFDRVGVAKLISDYATGLPRVDVHGKEYTSPVRSGGSAFGYSIQEIRAARMAGRPLETMKAEAARRAFEELVERIGAFGNEESGLKGFLNHPNVPVSSVEGDPWEDKTAEEIRKDIRQMIQGTIDLTNNVEKGPFTLLLPDAQYGLIATMQNSTASDRTVLQFVLESEKTWLADVAPFSLLKGAGVGGADRALLYTRRPDKLKLKIPQDFETFPPQEKGLEIEVPTHGRIGGIVWYYPLSARYVDGI